MNNNGFRISMEKLGNHNSMEQIMPKIWSIFELLKRSGKLNSVTEQAEFTLMLLLLYKDGLISTYKDKDLIIDSEPFYGQRLFSSYVKQSEAYRKGYDNLITHLSEFEDNLVRQITYTLFEIDKADLKQNFSSVFDSVLYHSSNIQGKFGPEFLQAAELSQLVAEIANVSDNPRVFNPFAGVASFAIFLKQYASYLGQENTPFTCELAELRLLAHGKQSNAVVECRNSITQWPDESEKFDLIVSTPPFGVRLNRMDLPNEMVNVRAVEEFLILEGLNSLTRKGQMIVVVPRGFLSSGLKSSLEVRKYLIRKDVLEMVISLPTGIFNSTNIATSILVINKNKPESDVVKFVNAEDCYTIQNNNILLDTQSVLSLINSGNQSNIAKTTLLHEIKDNNYNINPNIYFKKEIVAPKGFELRELREVLAKIKRITNHNDSQGRFVQISDLANDRFDYERAYSNISVVSLKKNAVRLNKSALLISKVSLNIKPTFFTKITDSPIYLSLNIEAFEIKDKSISMPYLIHELHGSYFQEQLNSLVSGSVIASVSTENFLSCKILVPSQEKQKTIVDESRKQLILEKEKELKDLKEKFEQQTYEEFASLKHALGKPIPGINTALEYIYDYLKSNQGEKISLTDVVSQRRQTTLQDKFEVIFNGLKLMRALLEKGEKGLVVEEYKLTGIKMGKVIKNFCKSYSSDKFSLRYSPLNKEFEQIEVLANKDLISVLLNDVLSNAYSHAFDSNDLENNHVDIYLSVQDNHLDLYIANNGISFPDNFDNKKFIQKYQKVGENSGAGIGGYDINRIASYFNGEFLLITEPILDYSTSYTFRFPILDIKEENHE